MSEYLPYEKFEWLENLDKFDVMSINEKSDTGYFLEVDLEYPDELHELHNDYPLAPEKLAVTNNMLHYRNLQLDLFLGMKLTKIRRMSKFKQSNWMRKYIDFNTEKRKKYC